MKYTFIYRKSYSEKIKVSYRAASNEDHAAFIDTLDIRKWFIHTSGSNPVVARTIDPNEPPNVVVVRGVKCDEKIQIRLDVLQMVAPEDRFDVGDFEVVFPPVSFRI